MERNLINLIIRIANSIKKTKQKPVIIISQLLMTESRTAGEELLMQSQRHRSTSAAVNMLTITGFLYILASAKSLHTSLKIRYE